VSTVSRTIVVIAAPMIAAATDSSSIPSSVIA